MGKSENYGFFENCCSLRPEKWYIQTTNGVHEYVITIGQDHLLTLASLSSIHTFQRSISLKLFGQLN